MAAHRELRLALTLVTWVAVTAIASAARADWAANGIQVSPGSPVQDSQGIAPDHAGGVILAWTDQRDGAANPAKLFVQRLNARGEGMWADGVGVADTPGAQGAPHLLSDTGGGALLLFTTTDTNGNADVRMQSVSPNGGIGSLHGVCIAGGTDYREVTGIVSDGQAGAFIVWRDYASPSRVLLQRVDASGQPDPSWPAGGISVSTRAGDQAGPSLASDGAGGVLVAWTDYRSGAPRAYVQRFAGKGSPYWPADGIPVCESSSDQLYVRVAADGSGGALLAWNDSRDGLPDVYAQHLLTNGARAGGWPADGLPVAVAPLTQAVGDVVSAPAGGLFVLWSDAFSGGGENNPDLFLQRIDADGSVHVGWAAAGLPISRAQCDQTNAHVLPMADGGVFVSWDDGRTCTLPGTPDIYVQRVTADGQIAPGWAANGFPVCDASGSQHSQQVALVDPAHAIVTWMDGRGGFREDLYAQQVRLADGGWETDAPNGCEREAHFLPCREGGILFAPRSASDATGLPSDSYVFDTTVLSVTREVGKAYFLSGSPDALTSWSCDDRIYVNGVDAGLGFSSTSAYDLCVPMDQDHGRESFRDITHLIPAGTSCVTFELKDTNRDLYGNTAIYLVSSETVAVPAVETSPAALSLRLVSANPARGGCEMSLELPVRAQVRLRVLDLAGRTVARLIDCAMEPGSHPVRWSTQRVSPGVYFVRLDAAGLGTTQRVVVLP